MNTMTGGESALGIDSEIVQVAAGHQIMLDGDLTIPAGVQGIVLFAHGSGSSRFSPRNRSVARTLNQGGLATLLFDLLTSMGTVENRTACRDAFIQQYPFA